ncbi:hypothetical protein Syun_024749 [Stephania yunnanensis]|uniref:Small auxin up regulated protein n=1 Tax=Stephania yunnanensis TaxID=152371 RepID=A0AAP0EZ66_9MAGN
MDTDVISQPPQISKNPRNLDNGILRRPLSKVSNKSSRAALQTQIRVRQIRLGHRVRVLVRLEPPHPSWLHSGRRGPDRDLFVIPIRLLNLPFFAALLQRSADQFGYPVDGPLILPCDAHFLDRVLNLLQKDEDRFGKFGPDEFDRFLNLFDKAGIDSTDKNKKKKKWRKPTFF